MAEPIASTEALHREYETGDAVVQAHQSVSLRSIPLVGINVLPATITEEVRMRCGG